MLCIMVNYVMHNKLCKNWKIKCFIDVFGMSVG